MGRTGGWADRQTDQARQSESFETRSQYADQMCHELYFVLPWSLGCQDYRQVTLCLAHSVEILGNK